jgi:hypothetical protein
MNWIDMKTQQRNFVVERKSGRRRLTMQPTSIWGDTDLKALVREAESDAPHLFDPNMVADTIGHDRELQTDTASETHQNDKSDTSDQKPIVALPIEAEQNAPARQRDNLTFNFNSDSVVASSQPPSPPRVTRSSRRGPTERNHYDSMKIPPPSVRSTAGPMSNSADELIALEEENRRLKGLLAQHYREQNMRLRTMLERSRVNRTSSR